MADKIKRIVILGSTGSIGRQTLDIVRALPEHFRVIGLAAGNNLSLLKEQVDEFQPAYVSYIKSGRKEFESPERHYLSMEKMAASPEADIVVVAVSGAAGLGVVMAAAEAGKTIALANKESLVAAGEIVTAAVVKNKARILPVDSEHSAIWQCLQGEKQPPRRIILTASGGPFRDYPAAKMSGITVAQALAHPSWKMGKKVTIDSATLMNKGLEVIEARWLFGIPVADIKVLVHPLSIVHSMVEFVDGTVKAQLSHPDMRFPIQYALSYPDRLPNDELPRLDWSDFPSLNFEPPNLKNFPCLQIAIEAGIKGGTYPAVLAAADEIAVELFLAERIKFTDIARLVSGALEKHTSAAKPAIGDILAADKWARETARQQAGGIA
jgi:1-deoxy-D-xylulose-5-phosphate reductoisomerase